MRLSEVTAGGRLLAVVVIVLSAGATLLAVSKVHGEPVGPGKHSAFTRDELRTNWRGAQHFPILVPDRLPDGAADAEEVGFSLSNVVVDPAIDPSKRVWLSFYKSDELGGIGSSFRIFQRPVEVPGQRPCGATAAGGAEDQPFVERRVGAAVLNICSDDLENNAVAREFWEKVDFTSELQRVAWLKG